eukprot:EC714492.1.p1 GENE.EC714492.1~~EC714492.1.p1  ORF type:complete len:197 (-),score=40.27 EC714492.1:11-559(-)
MLSAADGPLWTRIRGQGYAYGADVSLLSLDRQIALSVSQATAPLKALAEMADLLRTMQTDVDSLTQFEVETAKASTLFKIHARKSGVAGVIKQHLRALFLGYASMEDETRAENCLDTVTQQDVARVFWQYFPSFLRSGGRIVACVSDSDTAARRLQDELQQSEFAVNIPVTSFKDISRRLVV